MTIPSEAGLRKGSNLLWSTPENLWAILGLGSCLNCKRNLLQSKSSTEKISKETFCYKTGLF